MKPLVPGLFLSSPLSRVRMPTAFSAFTGAHALCLLLLHGCTRPMQSCLHTAGVSFPFKNIVSYLIGSKIS